MVNVAFPVPSSPFVPSAVPAAQLPSLSVTLPLGAPAPGATAW